MEDFSNLICRNCGSIKFKPREELTEDEKFIVERISTNSEISSIPSKHDQFCRRCLHQASVNRAGDSDGTRSTGA